MEKRNINLGGVHLDITASGVDEALDKVNLLVEKIKEARSLIEEMASMSVNINFSEPGNKLMND